MDWNQARPFMVWIIGTTVLLAMFFIGAYGTGWPPHLDICTKSNPITCYCEWFDIAALRAAEATGTAWRGVQQPVNTFSNLYAVVTAGYVACRVWRDRKLAIPPNAIMSKWWMGDVWVFCVLFLGLGSMWFHGSISAAISWFDGFSMYVFTGFLVFYTLDRGFARHGTSARTRTVVFWIGYPSAVMTFTILGILGIPSEVLIGAMLGAYAVFEIFYAGFVFSGEPSWRVLKLWTWKLKPALLWWAGLISFLLAAWFRAKSTSEGNLMCWPQSGFQPHGLLWHTLAGVMALCLYFYWREDNGPVGNLPPGYQ
jgi:hypothetical protein